MKINKVLFQNGKAYILYPSSHKKRFGKIITCKSCGKECFVRNEQIKNKRWGKFCSTECRNKGSNNPNWKGGKFIDSSGYIMIPMPGHPKSNRQGYVYEHRIVIETRVNRILDKKEVIHHINGIKTDNRLSNLLLTNHSDHRKIHANKT